LGAEANSEGIHVVNLLVELGYGSRMYHRRDDWPTVMKDRGWITNKQTRPDLLRDLGEAIRNRWIIPRCKDSVDEMMSFIRDESGKPGPAQGAYSDHVMAWALLWKMRQLGRWGRRSSGGVVEQPAAW
jgi:phage terminase large subunit